jgi:phage terminase small subunit
VKEARLTARERAFVLHFTGDAKGNGTQAARLAGYAGSPGVLGVQSARLLRKARVRATILSITDAKEKRGIATAEELDRILTSIARNPFHEPLERTAAAKELNKVKGRHSLTLLHKGRLTLVEAMGLSHEIEDP